ncbi:uncharacterized protein LOC144161480 isoform X4 [Haemaphysalis longicornis]
MSRWIEWPACDLIPAVHGRDVPVDLPVCCNKPQLPKATVCRDSQVEEISSEGLARLAAP